MNRRVTIVMYHFVRNLRRSRYPEIKGLDLADFVGQLEYISKHYNVTTMEDVIEAAHNKDKKLPERALLLTFDDGYAEHFHTVFPLLDRLGMQGSFFPPARAVLERRVLDVNKIHFLLASQPDKSKIVSALESEVAANANAYSLQPLEYYRQTYAHPNRYDTAEVVYIKRMLQKALPEDLRARIVDALFRDFVSSDEAAFAEELYVTPEQLRCMLRHGMFIGSHSYDHYWLDTLTPQEQQREVVRSMSFLRDLGCNMDSWVMCYPYGGHNNTLQGILTQNHCAIGLATEVDIADLDKHSPLALPRIDTNDLPKRGDAPCNDWTRAA